MRTPTPACAREGPIKLPSEGSVPTQPESGLADFSLSVWHGLHAPRNMPAPLSKLNEALRAALKDPELVKRQEALGIGMVSDARGAPHAARSR